MLGFAGAGEAIFGAMQLFVDPRDHVIVTAPNYQSIESIPLASGVEVSGLPLWSGMAPTCGGHSTWIGSSRCFDRTPPSSLGELPQQPTGFVSDHDVAGVQRAVPRAWCSGHERRVYRGVEMDLADTLPAAVEINPSALSINVISKAYGLPGLRVGWIASHDRAALIRLERAKHYTSICNAGPSEHLTALALRNGPAIPGATDRSLQPTIAS